MARMVRRSGYLEKLHAYGAKPEIIKVITGMRRCGKSTLMRQFREDLLDEGVESRHIFHVNFEGFEGMTLRDPASLRAALAELPRDGMTYILLDEVQLVDGWEDLVTALRTVDSYNVYITGSNSRMLSTDLATRISGRYVTIGMLPLSFKEYMELHPGDTDVRFGEFLMYGGLPDADPSAGEQYCLSYLEGVVSTVLIKDVLDRLRVDDFFKMRAIVRFLYSNVGNITNVSTIAREANVSPNTAERYLKALEDAMLFYHAERYDIVGKKLLKTNGKYYASDLGMRYLALEGAGGTDISRPLENAVFLELVRRGFTVRVGSFRDMEVDFTAVRGGEVRYYQVTQTMLGESTRSRELRPLGSIRDNHPKTVLTMDRVLRGSDEGIRVMNVIDWLLSGDA